MIFYHFWTVIDFSSEKCSGSTGHRNSWYQWRNFQWGCRWWDSNSQPLDYKPSDPAIELYSSISYCWEGVEFIQLVYCIIFYHFSTVIDFSSEKYRGSTGHRNSWYQWRNFQWGCRWWDSNSQPLDYKPSALAIELYSSISCCWEGVEFIQLVYCIIIFYHFWTVKYKYKVYLKYTWFRNFHSSFNAFIVWCSKYFSQNDPLFTTKTTFQW